MGHMQFFWFFCLPRVAVSVECFWNDILVFPVAQSHFYLMCTHCLVLMEKIKSNANKSYLLATQYIQFHNPLAQLHPWNILIYVHHLFVCGIQVVQKSFYPSQVLHFLLCNVRSALVSVPVTTTVCHTPAANVLTFFPWISSTLQGMFWLWLLDKPN